MGATVLGCGSIEGLLSPVRNGSKVSVGPVQHNQSRQIVKRCSCCRIKPEWGRHQIVPGLRDLHSSGRQYSTCLPGGQSYRVRQRLKDADGAGFGSLQVATLGRDLIWPGFCTYAHINSFPKSTSTLLNNAVRDYCTPSTEKESHCITRTLSLSRAVSNDKSVESNLLCLNPRSESSLFQQEGACIPRASSSEKPVVSRAVERSLGPVSGRRMLLASSLPFLWGFSGSNRHAFAEGPEEEEEEDKDGGGLARAELETPEEEGAEERVEVTVDVDVEAVATAEEATTVEEEQFGFDGLGRQNEEYAAGRVVALAQSGEGAVLFLGVEGYEVPLRMVVGAAEAMAVLTAAQERKARRPVTHEAWGLTLAAVGWRVERVTITAIDDDVYQSRVILGNPSSPTTSPAPLSSPSPSAIVVEAEAGAVPLQSLGMGLRSVDVRPSDGIALALRCRAPLFVAKEVAETVLANKKAKKPGDLNVDPLDKPGLQARGDARMFVGNDRERFFGTDRSGYFTVSLDQ